MSVLFENTVRGTLNGLCFIIWSSHKCSRLPTRQQDVVTTSLCTSQWRRRYVSNETPNDFSVVRLHDVSNKSQMKHPMTSQWYVTKTSQWYVFTTSYWYVVMTSHGDVMMRSHQYVSTTSQTSLKWNTQWHLSATSLRRLSGTYPPCPISTSPRRLL